MFQSKSKNVFFKIAKEYYNPSTSDKFFNHEVSKSRANSLLKKKFDLTGRIANDVKLTGGIYKVKINKLEKPNVG